MGSDHNPRNRYVVFFEVSNVYAAKLTDTLV